MNAYDFSVNYYAGLMLLWGKDPYSVWAYHHPLPFTFFWALLALPGLVLPPELHYGMPLMFLLWGVVNTGLLLWSWRRQFWQWVFYFPFLHELSAGQNEMMFWTMERYMNRGWRGALLGALLTMKAPTALILLPWHLVDWLRHDRRTLARWFALTALLWGLPLLWRPDWLAAWLSGRGTDSNLIYSASVSNGVFTLLRLTGTSLTPPLPPLVLTVLIALALLAALLYLVGQFQPNKALAKALALLANPLGLLYTQMTLMGTAPWWLLVPVNWLSLALVLTTGNLVAAMLTPLAVIGWHLYDTRRQARRRVALTAAG